jgi:ParB family chromosome partitioning protein
VKRLKYADLIEPIRKLFLENKIGIGHADLAARLQPDQQKEVFKALKADDDLTVSDLRAEIERTFFLSLTAAPFDPTDEKLVPKAGSCLNCPKRTGFNKALFDDIQQQDVCTDRVCFEDKTRAFIKIQVGTHKDAVLLSICGDYETSKAKHLTGWVKAGDKNCPDTKLGVVVEQVTSYPSQKQEAKLGQAIKVCTNPKCKTHYPPAPKQDYDPQTGRSKEAEKKRKLELKRRGMIFAALQDTEFDTSDKDYRAVLDHMIHGLSSDHARGICKAMNWEPEKSKFGGKDFQGTVAKHLEKLSASGVNRWTYLLMLAEAELWFYSGGTVKAELLEAKAKQAGISLDKIAKEAAAKPVKAKKEPKAKKESKAKK